MGRMLLSLWFLFTLVVGSLAQDLASISGKVVTSDQSALPFASVVLQSIIDDSIVKVKMTDEDGAFLFEAIKVGNYQLIINYLGFNQYTSENILIEGTTSFVVPVIELENSANELATVTIRSTRPLVEIEPGKLIFNVEGSINAIGDNALELLRKAPGVNVDNQDNISLLGKNGVLIYIDNKAVLLTGSNLTDFLRTIQSDEVAVIEVISNPSAKYDAEGNAGVINIRMKKNKKYGSNTRLNLDYSIGQKPRYGATIGTSFRNQKINAYGTYTYSDVIRVSESQSSRQQYNKDLIQERNTSFFSKGHNTRVGIDGFLNDKNTLGLLISNYSARDRRCITSQAQLYTVGQSQVDSTLRSNSENITNREYWNVNLNYNGRNDKGVNWNLDANYGRFNNTGNERQPNQYFDANENLLSKRNYFNSMSTLIDIWTLKLDAQYPLLKGQLNLGGKLAYILTENNFEFFNSLSLGDELDLDRSSIFNYEENINAVYTNYQIDWGKVNLSLGVRLEQTNSKGKLDVYNGVKEVLEPRHYLNVFPSGGLTYVHNEDNNFQLNISRRIHRPSYQDLNPFIQQVDDLGFQQGNPFLQPEYTNSIQLVHSYKKQINTTLRFSRTQNLITRIRDTTGLYTVASTWENLANQSDYSLNVNGAFAVKRWWNTFTDVTFLHLQNKADFGEGKKVNLSANNVSFSSQHTFLLPKNLSVQYNIWYTSPSLWQGTFRIDEIWGMDIGVKMRLWDGRGILQIALTDPFRTYRYRVENEFSALNILLNGRNDSRRFKLNFSYLLGNKKVKNRRRRTGQEEENRRVRNN